MSRLRRSVRRRWISRRLMLRHRIQGAEFFRALSSTNRGIVCSETPPYPQQSSEPPSRASKRRDQPSKSPRNSGSPSAESAPLAERLSTASRQPSSVQSDEGASVSPRVATTEQSQVVGNSGSPALSAKAKRRDESAISRDDASAKPLPNDQQSAIGRDFPATLPSRVEDRSPQSRKRTIMTRYVFGDELKPGERWKRRLLTTR